MELKDRVSLVTGAGRGIGFAIAKRLAKSGSNIAICDIDETTANEAAKKIEETGVKAVGIKANVADYQEVESMIKKVVSDLGTINILVNNAGITRDGLLMRMKEEDWDSVININLKSAFLCTKQSIRHIMKSGYGRIINIASVVGLMGNIGQSNYSASKGGLISFTKTIAKEFASRKITANAIAPGFIKTPMTDKLKDEDKNKLKELIPLSDLGSPENVADCAAFFASPYASYITGQVVAVDGGMTM